jgi:arylsulfatase A-like enzyme
MGSRKRKREKQAASQALPADAAPRRGVRARAAVIILLLAGGAVAAAVVGPKLLSAPPAPPDQPNILLYSIDTLRADHLGCYGRSQAQTPNIDRLAREGARYAQALTTVPVTVPSHTSMLSGLWPATHGARGNEGFSVPGDVTTLPELLRSAGWQTGGFIGGMPLHRICGLAQGFDHYDDDLAPWGDQTGLARRSERTADDVVDAALAWLESRDPNRPTFAFVHVFDPHAPYETPLPGAARGSYDGEIARVDRALGRLLDRLADMPRWASSLKIVTADHGESLGEHGEATHGVFTYQSTLHVPLIVHWPGRVDPGRVDTPASLVDVSPTLLKLAGQSVPLAMQGRPLPGSATDHPLYFESLYGELLFAWSPLRGVRMCDMKFIEAPAPELYDLAADPGESRNLYRDDARAVITARAWLKELGDGVFATALVDSSRRHDLEGVGYITGSAPRPDDDESRIDPKDAIADLDEFMKVQAMYSTGRAAQGLIGFKRLEPTFRYSPFFYREWGLCEMAVNDQEQALTRFTRALKLDPNEITAQYNIGVALMNLERYRESLAAFQRVLDAEPDFVTARIFAGQVALKMHEFATARAHWQHFVDIAPTHPKAPDARRLIDQIDRAGQPKPG